MPEDYTRSYLWRGRAVSGGVKEAPALLKELEKKMTPGQMKKARRLLRWAACRGGRVSCPSGGRQPDTAFFW